MPRRAIGLGLGLLAVIALAALAFACASPRGASTPQSATIKQSPTDRETAWLREHAVPLRAAVTGDDDFADLEPLRETLGRARIVVLGEADHGDGTTFTVKTRLVRFLHQRLGYDVLAFESGFYECWKAEQQIAAGKDPAAAFRDSVFRVWTVSRQVQPLIDDFAAAARSPRPLVLTGFDPQFTGANSQLFVDDLKHVAELAGVPHERFTDRFAGSLANLVEGRYEEGVKPDAAAREEFFTTVSDIEERLRGNAAVPERDFWIRLLTGLRQLTVSSWATDWSKPLLEDTVNYPVRDRVMGEHLIWLARQRFPRQKIVVWMHSFHAARGLSGVATSRADLNRLWRTFQPAGAVAHAELGDEVYTVGVLAHHGQRRFANLKVPPKDIPPPAAGSLEDLFHRTGHEIAFLDLRHTRGQPRWLLAPLLARTSNNEQMRARWRKVFDGFLFIDAMEPSEKVPTPRAAPATPTP